MVVLVVLTTTAPRRWSRTVSVPAPALTAETSPSISSPAWPRGTTTAVEPVTATVIALVPGETWTLARALMSARENSISTLPTGTPVSEKLPEVSVWADRPVRTTRTVTPGSPIPAPSVVAPNVPLPRTIVPRTMALPDGDVGEDVDS